KKRPPQGSGQNRISGWNMDLDLCSAPMAAMPVMTAEMMAVMPVVMVPRLVRVIGSGRRTVMPVIHHRRRMMVDDRRRRVYVVRRTDVITGRTDTDTETV